MSEALNKICGITAKELLEKYGDSDNLPIELTEILKNLSISALSMDFNCIEQMPEIQEKIKDKR